MYYQKHGMPEEGELVMCTVTKILPTSVFAKLDHFEGKNGILHISEIAPGRIRNLKEYVSEGKMLVCQVLKVNKERGHIDLSLRRVSESRKVKKLSEMKQELKAEKIVEAAAEELKAKPEELYKSVADKALADYEYLHQYFMAIVQGETELSALDLPKKTEQVLADLIAQRIKLPMVEIAGIFKLRNHAGNGVDVVKFILEKVSGVDTSLSIKYGGGGTYPFIIQKPNFEEAEQVLKKAVDVFEDSCKDKATQFSYERREGKQVEL